MGRPYAKTLDKIRNVKAKINAGMPLSQALKEERLARPTWYKHNGRVRQRRKVMNRNPQTDLKNHKDEIMAAIEILEGMEPYARKRAIQWASVIYDVRS